MKKNLLFAGLIALASVSVKAQCTDYVNPAPPLAYINLGEAPCNGESYEITDFEMGKSEAYWLLDLQMGGNYTLSICNGPHAGSWIPEFTIVAPSGAIDTYGAGDGDGCSITWTASESGNYKALTNEAGNCGVADAVKNGYPKITTNSGGRACAVFLEGAESFELPFENMPDCWQIIDADGDGYTWFLQTTSAAFDGNKAMLSYSFGGNVNSPVRQSNYLITPQVTLGANDSLYYAIREYTPIGPKEFYSVFVSTTGAEISDFTDEILSDSLRAVHGWKARSVNLSAYANQTVYLAFEYSSPTGGNGLYLDGVKLPGTVICGSNAISELDKVESTIFPNPATDILNVSSTLEGAATIRVFDALGRLVLENDVTLSSKTFTQNVSALENGLYTIQIKTSDNVSIAHFVKM